MGIKKHLIGVTLVFFVSLALGYWTGQQNPDGARAIVDSLTFSSSFIKNANSLVVFLFIFLNNSIKAFLIILFGFLLGLIPISFIFFNGYVIGLVIFVVGQKIGLETVIIGLLPHGILEIPAVLLAAAYGTWLGFRFYRKAMYGEFFREHILFALKNFFCVILPLLFIAAIIETYISAYIINKLK